MLSATTVKHGEAASRTAAPGAPALIAPPNGPLGWSWFLFGLICGWLGSVAENVELPPGLDRHVLAMRRTKSGSAGGNDHGGRYVGTGIEEMLDGDGFLDPNPMGSWWNPPAVTPRPVTDLIGSSSSFVLLAPGGVGKSTVLTELWRREPGAVEVDLMTLDKGELRQELTAATMGGGPVYVDALDVAAREMPATFRILERQLSTPEAQQVCWRMACRPAGWSASLAGMLRTALPGFEELTLLPLSRAAAEALASRMEVPGFVDAIVEAKLGRLSASALRLQAAAAQWRSTRRLPESHLTAIEYEVAQLLTETNEQVPTTLPADRRSRIAMRLAAMSMFGGINRFARHAEPARPGRVHLDALPSTPEPDEPGTQIGSDELTEVVGTALFDAASDAATAFRHQQYAEHLAAKYITTRQVTRQQLRELLACGDNGLVPGVLAGVLAWLAALKPDWVDDLVTANAVALAQTGVEIPSDEVRATVVVALLNRAAAGDIDLEWGLDLTGLAYPGLEAKLARRLSAGVASSDELWWIARLAEAGQCTRLGDELLPAALDPTHLVWARRAAAIACGALAEDSVLTQLSPLLHLDRGEDPDDELLAAVVEVLYPRLMSTSELLEVLRPRRNTRLVGAYLVLLGQLGDRIPAEDLPDVIIWATTKVGAGEQAFGRLLPQLVVTGWHHAHRPEVLASLASLVSAVVRSPGSRWPAATESAPWQDGDAEDRRQLAILVAEHLDQHLAYELVDDLALITEGDVEWILTHLPDLPIKAHAALTECVPHLIRQPSAREADRILMLPTEHPAYATTEHLRATVTLASPHGQRAQERRQRQLAAQARRAELAEKMRHDLTEAIASTAKDVRHWWRVACALAGEQSSHPNPLFTHDLTQRPGWRFLTPYQQQQVLEQGLRYVRSHQAPLSATSDIAGIAPSEVSPGWSGVYLLTTLTKYEPETVRSIEASVWQHWAPAIISAGNVDSYADARLRADLIDLAPSTARQSLADAALARLDAYHYHGNSLTRREMYECLIDELAIEIGERLATGSYDGALANILLDILIKQAPDVARATCARLREDEHSELAQLARRGQAQLEPDIVVDELANSNATTDDLIENVPALTVPELSDYHLSVLARLLLDRFPITNDPPWSPQHYGPSGVRRARTAVLDQLAARGASQSLVDLHADRPELDQAVIGYYLRDARSRAANLAFTPMEPKHLLTLLNRADARLVRTEADLLDVVIANLDELQHDISHNSSFRFLWNYHDNNRTPKSEDDISDWVQDKLRTRLTNGSVVGREVQVTRPAAGGIGTRIDLCATSATATQPVSLAQVIIEAKLINHPKLMTAMRDQLVQQYLVPTGVHHGVYLIYWVTPEQRPSQPTSWTRKDRNDHHALVQEMKSQAAALGNGLSVRPYLLDISPPS